jgi:uncharacterized protein YcnI
MRELIVAALTGAFGLGLASPALAHVTVQPNEAIVGSFARFVVRVPNERGNADTTRVEVEFPPLAFVSFEDAVGWQREVEMRTLDEPLEVFGDEITEVVGTVAWSGGAIEPGEFAEFGFSARMPDQPTTLEFPAIQTYDGGQVVRWIGSQDSEAPAAQVTNFDLGAGEGQGELAVLAELLRERESSHDEESDTGGSGVLLGWIAIALATLAVVLSLVSRRRTT